MQIEDLNINVFFCKNGQLNSNKLREFNLTSKDIYDFINGSIQCKFCNSIARFISFNKGYSETCNNKECSNKLRKETNLMVYGTEFSTQNKEIKDKISKNSKANLQETKNKRKKTNIDRFGYFSPFELDSVQDKIKETNLLKYNVSNQMLREDFQEKSKITKEKLYNDINYNNQDKIKETNLLKYNVDHLSKQNHKNTNNFNKKYIKENFVKNNRINLLEFLLYFNFSESYGRIKLKELDFKYKFLNSRSFETQKINKLFNSIFIENDRTLIKPLEIDLLSHEYKFGIEYNGLMWHSIGESKHSMFNNLKDEDILKYRHLNKTNLMEQKGYQLFHIFENEWLDKNKKDIWISIIEEKIKNKKNKIIKTKNLKNKEIKIINDKIAKEFFNKNHLNGYKKAKINIGLYIDNILYSIMSFTDNKLVSFAKNIDYNIEDPYTEILSKYKIKSLITEIDNRFNDNELLKLGFKEVKTTDVNFFIWKGRKIYDCGLKILEKE